MHDIGDYEDRSPAVGFYGSTLLTILSLSKDGGGIRVPTKSILWGLESIHSKELVNRAEAGYSGDDQYNSNNIKNDPQGIISQNRPANYNQHDTQNQPDNPVCASFVWFHDLCPSSA
jgi:hypothetical protein